MNLLHIVLIGFIVLEGANVIALYFFPDSRNANSMGVFSAWEKSKGDPETHRLVRYLVNWVAGAKLIFLALLLVIVLTADTDGLFLAALAMVVSISTFFWRLYPLIRQMDREGQIVPRNYSTRLGWMITLFLVMFLAALLLVGRG